MICNLVNWAASASRISWVIAWASFLSRNDKGHLSRPFIVLHNSAELSIALCSWSGASAAGGESPAGAIFSFRTTKDGFLRSCARVCLCIFVFLINSSSSGPHHAARPISTL